MKFQSPFLRGMIGFVLLLGSCLASAQNNPYSALQLDHYWSWPQQYIDFTFEGMTDSEFSEAVGPDCWFTFTATDTSLAVSLNGSFSDGLEYELFDENLEPISSEEYPWFNFGGLSSGSVYFVSITKSDPETAGAGSIALLTDNYICKADFDFNGFTNADDLLFFLMEYGHFGPLNQDFDYNQIVNVLDLNQFLTFFGQPSCQ